MPNNSYVNGYQPNTAIGASLQNLTAAFFGAKRSQQEQDLAYKELAMKDAVYGSQSRNYDASARKATAESDEIENKTKNMRLMPPAIQAGGGNAEQIAKAQQQLYETEQFIKASNNPVLIETYNKLIAASKGSAMYAKGDNGTTFNQYDGEVLNDGTDNLLLQSRINYGNDGTLGGQSRVKVNNSIVDVNNAKVGTEKAQQGKYYADTAKTKAETGSVKLKENYIGDDANGNPMYKNVVNGVNTVITKAAPKQAKPSIIDAKESKLRVDLAQKLYGLDTDSAVAVVAESEAEASKTGNLNTAMQNAIARLTGGQPLIENDDGVFNWTEPNIPNTKAVPKKAPAKATAPAKQAKPVNVKDIKKSLAENYGI